MARIRLKLNALVDPTIIEELYAASAAGVPIEICARSICMLRPGVEGLSETIRVRSIVGRFLEHSRIYWFEAGDETSVFLGSADLMPRNLDRRIEVLTPVENVRARAEVGAILDSAFADTTNTWELGADGDLDALEAKAGKAQHAPGGDDAPRPDARPARALVRAGRASGARRRSPHARRDRRRRLEHRAPARGGRRCRRDGSSVEARKAYLGLGAEIAETGTLSDRPSRPRRRRAGGTRSVRDALGAARAEVIVTAPGRQGAARRRSSPRSATRTGCRSRILSADDEGRLAFEGAVACPPIVSFPRSSASSTSAADRRRSSSGRRAPGPCWVRSIDLGSLRLTRLALPDDPPGRRASAAFARGPRRRWRTSVRSGPMSALAVGGSARALARLVGRTLRPGRRRGDDRTPRPSALDEGRPRARHRADAAADAARRRDPARRGRARCSTAR